MSKAFTKSLLVHFNKIVRRLRPFVVHAHPPSAAERAKPYVRRPSTTSTDEQLLPAPDTTTDVTLCKVEGGLLMSPSVFPYFMLVALEAGGLVRGLLLLLLYPVLLLLGHDRAVKVMVMVSFAGLRKDGFRLGRAVMPKLFLEDVSAEVFEAAAAPGARRRRRVVCVSAMPREMVEPFLVEYLGVDAVVAPELRVYRGYYLGLTQADGEVLQRLDMEEVIGLKERHGGDGQLFVAGIAGLGSSFHQLFRNYCKEVYVATESARRRRRRPLHPRWYSKPLIFHDGRIAFRPTASATLAMFMWMPLAAPLAVLRTVIFLLLPFSLSVQILGALGMHCRYIAASSLSAARAFDLFVCNHRCLLDPLYVSAVSGRADLAAATYSISRLSEILAPIRTFRLTRDRAADRAAMQAHLSRRPGAHRGGGGGLVVCPEGTTCREPFLLRFSPLFTELGADVQPVALYSEVAMFHGTTAGGWKLLDPFFLLMNPSPAYVLQFLDPVAEAERGGGGPEVANEVQRRIAAALGYTCTALTRRDKYLVLAGNDGVVASKSS
ncbi:probable glycerol-3-phosphate acyltransferase 3 [Oryza brachyantha]|uniref:probable glycerol-3-phosphate acyltransferase 3 n=1 Tax=Oryza brachyantha TaxID=4533 RepID=UPI001ADA90FA|nr:probable glycerol-3-phosphate acyltransferase 3 [Oryza brachyantha]